MVGHNQLREKQEPHPEPRGLGDLSSCHSNAVKPSSKTLPLLSRSLTAKSVAEEIDLTNPETLETLIQSSKTLESRSHLYPHLQTLLHLLSPSNPNPNLLLLHLRLLRNLLAGDIAVQSSFLRSNGPDAIASIVLQSPSIEVLKVGLQVLGNLALGGEAHRAAVWARLFPEGFLDLARVRVCDQLCMVLDTCCSDEGGRRRLQELCGDERGLEIVVEIIRTACYEGYQEEWLEWLLTKICIEESYLPELFATLGPLSVSYRFDGAESQNIMFTIEQAFVFRTVSYCLSERPSEVTVSTESALGVLKILKEATCSVDFTYRGSSELPTGSLAIDVLGYSIVILRDICAWEVPSSLGSEPHVNSLLSAGIVELFLSLLRELEPPLIVKKSIAQAIRQGEQLVMAGKVCPYKGYRRDLVSVLANCLHKKRHVQDEIRERNGIMLLLQQGVIDEDNPFLKEWGQLALRNLLDGNLENQRAVADLQLQAPLQTPEISSLGLRVEIDEKSGRAKVVNVS